MRGVADTATPRLCVLDELAAIQPLDAAEREHLADALAWAGSEAELFRREKPATPPKHLVSYVVVIDGEHILLVDHKNAQLWLPPGGHVEPNEHPRVTVVRELKEELGIATHEPIGPPLMVTSTQTVGLTPGHIDVSLWYVVHVDRRQDVVFDEEEFRGIQWFAFADAPLRRSDPHLGRLIAKLRMVRVVSYPDATFGFEAPAK